MQTESGMVMSRLVMSFRDESFQNYINHKCQIIHEFQGMYVRLTLQLLGSLVHNNNSVLVFNYDE